MASVELHGTAEDPGYVRKRVYRLSDMRKLTEEDSRALEIELGWDFGPAEVHITSRELSIALEDGLVSWDRRDRLDAFIGAYATRNWLAPPTSSKSESSTCELIRADIEK